MGFVNLKKWRSTTLVKSLIPRVVPFISSLYSYYLSWWFSKPVMVTGWQFILRLLMDSKPNAIPKRMGQEWVYSNFQNININQSLTTSSRISLVFPFWGVARIALPYFIPVRTPQSKSGSSLANWQIYSKTKGLVNLVILSMSRTVSYLMGAVFTAGVPFLRVMLNFRTTKVHILM